MQTVTKSMAVIRMGLASLQVCVQADCSDQEVEEFANRMHPTGISSQWAIRRAGDSALSGDPERQPCASQSGCVHIMLDC